MEEKEQELRKLLEVTDEDLENRTRHHPPRNEEVKAAHEKIRRASFLFMKALKSTAPNSRELNLALVSAEEAMMWANAAIARNPL